MSVIPLQYGVKITPSHGEPSKSVYSISSPFGKLNSFFPPAKHALQRNPRPTSIGTRQSCRSSLTLKEDPDADIIIIGGGIIGLAIAHQLLTKDDVTVALIDSRPTLKDRKTGAATGAGQGYIWMGHRSPDTPTWQLAMRGKLLWEKFVEESQVSETAPLGWIKTGSLLVGQTSQEAETLKRRAEALNSAGVESIFLNSEQSMEAEPALRVNRQGGSVLVPEDGQLDADLAVDALLKNCYASGKGRFQTFFQEEVTSLIRSDHGSRVSGVETTNHSLRAGKAVILATGAWSGSLMKSMAISGQVVPPVRPRKGHLLVLNGLPDVQLRHALMEAEYSRHYSSASSAAMAENVSMTLTRGSNGHLLLGSSREWTGFDTRVDSHVISAMVERAQLFVPSLAGIHPQLVDNSMVIRTGLRPYSDDGRPLIGPIPGLHGLLTACGHEGSGLCMALSTAELIHSMVMGVDSAISFEPFLPVGRLK